MGITEYSKKVYAAECNAAVGLGTRPLDRSTIEELATRIIGAKVKTYDLSDIDVDRGVIAGAAWWRGQPWIGFAGEHYQTDLIMAHEVGHLIADRQRNTGHGPSWLTGYTFTLRNLHRREVAVAMSYALLPIVTRQPKSDLLAAASAPRD